MKPGDKVEKISGYKWPGVIVASLWAVARGGDALPYHNTDDED
jgi:hypothetical protein